jgi:hypothetical protein
MTDQATPAKVRLTDGLGPDGKLHADGYFTWHRRDGYVLDAKLPTEFVLLEKARAATEAARMAGVHSVQEQTAVIVRAALELLESIEGETPFTAEAVRAFKRVFGA